ncbi:WD40-repeat-containing domain protein [Phascolomyces articulosus]|uniref:WD40-repeat-containing domain protein n=1 Tax=Phascolomyces articulosus TaxID=60185 RepID=A0AAD5JS59_9FUNG|nr:WD40-repeat-containing domain protein [Phascolomyces articulosus]
MLSYILLKRIVFIFHIKFYHSYNTHIKHILYFYLSIIHFIMSSKIQRGLRDRERFQIKFKPGGGFSRNKFVKKIYSDESIMARMTLYKELQGHDGCVNSLYWSHEGDKLLSGSDDTMVCVWLPWENYRMAYAIETGHTSNIFSAKFMPKSSDSVIVTAAGDSEIRVFDVNGYDEHRLRHVYTCHRDRAKRIALEDNPHEFMSCSEDGTVRHFDLRQPHSCSNAPFGRSRYHGRRQASSNVREGCPSPLVDYGPYGLDLNTLSINSGQPHYFIVAGMDDYVYMHDRRMVGNNNCGAGKIIRSPTKASRCVRRFTCKDSNYWKRNNKHVTACKFSDANSQEFIGSWSTDGIFLFNIHDAPVGDTREHNIRQSSQVKRNGRFNEEPYENRQSIIYCFRQGQLNNALDKLHLIHSGQTSREQSEEEDMSDNDIGETIWILCMKAAVHLRRVHESTHERPSDESHAEEEIANARRLMQDAESWCMTRLPSWRTLWCLAVGYWIACGGQQTIGCEDREDWLRKAYRYTVRAKQAYDASSSSGTASLSVVTHHVPDMFTEFKRDIRQALRRENYTPASAEDDQVDSDDDGTSITSSSSAQQSTTDRWKWLDEMYVIQREDNGKDGDDDATAGDIGQPSSKRPRHASTGSNEENTREQSLDRSTSATSRHATIGSSSDDQHQFSESMISDDQENNDSTNSNNNNSNSSINNNNNNGDNDTIVMDNNNNHSSRSSVSSSSSNDRSSQSSHVIEVEITEEYVGSDSDVSASDDRASDSDASSHHSTLSHETATEDSQSMMDTDESDDQPIQLPLIRRHIRLDEDSSDEDEDDDGDSDSYTRHSNSRNMLENDVDLVSYRKRYIGHCNNRTVKDVNFYGLNDEYVVSGSDDGCAFIWDKATGRIVQVLTADSDTVNVIQGHPLNPTMAMSGIDHTIKIFNPISALTTSRKRLPNERSSWSSSSRMYELDRILARNEEDNRSASDDTYITQSMITALTRSMQNGRELGRLRELMHDNWGGDIDCRVQ